MTEDNSPAARINKRYLLITIVGMWCVDNRPSKKRTYVYVTYTYSFYNKKTYKIQKSENNQVAVNNLSYLNIYPLMP
mgnify:CR=1 FL=1